jgi:hypothetical protein
VLLAIFVRQLLCTHLLCDDYSSVLCYQSRPSKLSFSRSVCL